MKHLTRLLLLGLLPMLCACGSRRDTATALPPPFVPDEHQVWQLTELRGRTLPRDGKHITLVFNPKTGYLNGQGPCNTFSATYTLSATGTLHVGAIAGGDIRCPDADLNAELRFTATLAKADRAEATPTTLTLFQRQQPLLKFELQ